MVNHTDFTFSCKGDKAIHHKSTKMAIAFAVAALLCINCVTFFDSTDSVAQDDESYWPAADWGVRVQAQITDMNAFDQTTLTRIHWNILDSLFPSLGEGPGESTADFRYDGAMGMYIDEAATVCYLTNYEVINGSVNFTYNLGYDYPVISPNNEYSDEQLVNLLGFDTFSVGDKIQFTADVNFMMYSDIRDTTDRRENTTYIVKETEKTLTKGYIDFKKITITHGGNETELSAIVSVNELMTKNGFCDYDWSHKDYETYQGVGLDKATYEGEICVKLMKDTDNIEYTQNTKGWEQSSSSHTAYAMPYDMVLETMKSVYQTVVPCTYTDLCKQMYLFTAIQSTDALNSPLSLSIDDIVKMQVAAEGNTIAPQVIDDLSKQAAEYSEVMMSFESDDCIIDLDNTAVRNLVSEDFEVRLNKEDNKSYNMGDDALVLDLNLGKNHDNFNGGKIGVTAVFLGNTSNLKAYYLENGSIKESLDVTVNNDGTVSFETGHLSTYVIADASYGESQPAPEKKENTISKETDQNNVDLTAEDIASYKEKAANDPSVTLSVSLGDGISVVFDNASLKALGDSAANLKVETVDTAKLDENVKKIAGDNPVFEIGFGDNTNFGTGKVSFTVPYTLPEGKDASQMKVYYLKDGAIAEKIDCTYENGKLTFATNHLSMYTVGFETPAESGEVGLVNLIAAAVLAAGIILTAICAIAASVRKNKA